MSEIANQGQCYEQGQWRSYQEGILGEAERSAMEEHLLTCEVCIETYLGILENSLNNVDTPKVSQGFTDRLFEVIEQEKIRPEDIDQVVSISNKKDKEDRNNKINLLISYCAAASIAMFFWVGGYFDELSGSFAKGAEYLHTFESVEAQVEPQRSLIQTGWTQKVMEEERPSFLENLKPKKE